MGVVVEISGERSSVVKRVLKWTAYLLVSILLSLSCICIVIFFIQGKLLYSPVSYKNVREADIIENAPDNIQIRPFDLDVGNGAKMRSYWISEKHTSVDLPVPCKYKTTILFLHGTGGNLEKYFSHISLWLEKVSVNVLFVSYRGFGFNSESESPLMANIKSDTMIALDYIKTVVPSHRIILYGHSMGGAVAFNLAAEDPTKFNTLIVENTFTSIPAMAFHFYPYIAWAKFVVTETWNNLEAIQKLSSLAEIKNKPFPDILMVSGEKDPIVPKSHMEILIDVVDRSIRQKRPGALIQYKKYSECEHACIYIDSYRDDFQSFLRKSLKIHL